MNTKQKLWLAALGIAVFAVMLGLYAVAAHPTHVGWGYVEAVHAWTGAPVQEYTSVPTAIKAVSAKVGVVLGALLIISCLAAIEVAYCLFRAYDPHCIGDKWYGLKFVSIFFGAIPLVLVWVTMACALYSRLIDWTRTSKALGAVTAGMLLAAVGLGVLVVWFLVNKSIGEKVADSVIKDNAKKQKKKR